MKVSFLVDDISLAGGAERVVVDLSNSLKKIGLTINIYTVKKDYNEPFYEIDPNIKIINLNQSTEKTILKKIFQNFKILKKLNRIEKIENSDLLFGVSTLNTIRLYFSILNSQKIYAYEHIEFNSVSKKLSSLRKIVYRKIFGVVCLTEKDKAEYLEMNNNVSVIENRLPFYPESLSSKKENIILGVGRLTKRKGFDMLISAFSLINSNNWILKIVGEGVEKKELLKQIKELKLEKKVLIEDFTKNIKREYEKSSVYVLSSTYEGFGMVLIEAMAYGNPCVSFDCPNGPSDIIKDKVDGFLVEPNNVKELSEKIKLLMNDGEKREKMGKEARSNVLRYSEENIMKKWKKLLSKRGRV